MSNQTLNLDTDLAKYLVEVGGRESKLLHGLRTETHADERIRDQANMQIAPEQGQFLHLLVRLIGAQRALEVGTFTGYSSICIAEALGDDGILVCCDINEEFTSIARRYWCLAGLSERVDLRIAPALDTMNLLLESGQKSSFDFIFLDADKANYDRYYELSLQLIRQGGLIAIDNVFWDGRVLDEQATDADTMAIKALNAKLKEDPRIDYCMVPIADGVSLCRKR